MTISSIHPDTESFRVGVEQIVKDLYPAIAKEDGINVPAAAYRPIAEELASDLKHLGVAPTDFSLPRWLGEFGISALVDFLQMYDAVEPGDSAFTVTFSADITIEDAAGGSVTLTRPHALRVAALITSRAADGMDEPTPTLAPVA